MSTTAYLASLMPGSLRELIKSILLCAMQSGPSLSHVAFIMDGNRRWARPKGYRAARGHAEGFEALKGLLEFLLHLRVQQVTVYAFAVDNFNRPPEEVDALMDLAQRELVALAQEGALLEKHDVRVNILGRRELLPLDVQEACLRVESMTAGHKNAILNVCVAYSGQDEIRATILANSCTTRPSHAHDAFEHGLYTSQTRCWTNPDLVIRTSGVSRLSDFLLWQATDNTNIHVLPCYWPDIGVADVIPVLLDWQFSRLTKYCVNLPLFRLASSL